MEIHFYTYLNPASIEFQDLWPKGPSWSTKVWARSILYQQERYANNERRRLYYHSSQRNSYDRERENRNKRRRRERIWEYRPKQASILRAKDATRKRQSRAKMTEETLKLYRQKHATEERKRIADFSPDKASDERFWKAKNERNRRATHSDLIKSIERYDNTVRVRASRDGKKVSHHKLLSKEDIVIQEESNYSAQGRKKLRRSPETRKKHAQYEYKRVASMSPGKATERKKQKAEQQKKRRNAMSEEEKRAVRKKNAEGMRKKRGGSKQITIESEPSIRRNFKITWTWRLPKYTYFTVIDGKEYVQYQMHALLIGK